MERVKYKITIVASDFSQSFSNSKNESSIWFRHSSIIKVLERQFVADFKLYIELYFANLFLINGVLPNLEPTDD